MEELVTLREAAANITFGSLWLHYKEKASMFKGLVVMNIDEGKYAKWLEPSLASKPLKDICEDDLEKIQKKCLKQAGLPLSSTTA